MKWHETSKDCQIKGGIKNNCGQTFYGGNGVRSGGGFKKVACVESEYEKKENPPRKGDATLEDTHAQASLLVRKHLGNTGIGDKDEATAETDQCLASNKGADIMCAGGADTTRNNDHFAGNDRIPAAKNVTKGACERERASDSQ
jgi:hypothetical protein